MQIKNFSVQYNKSTIWQSSGLQNSIWLQSTGDFPSIWKNICPLWKLLGVFWLQSGTRSASYHWRSVWSPEAAKLGLNNKESSWKIWWLSDLAGVPFISTLNTGLQPQVFQFSRLIKCDVFTKTPGGSSFHRELAGECKLPRVSLQTSFSKTTVFLFPAVAMQARGSPAPCDVREQTRLARW